MHTRVSVYVHVYEEREQISITLVTTAALKGVRVISACHGVCVRVCAGTVSLIPLLCLFVCQCTPKP